MILQYKFEEHGLQELLIPREFGIKQNLRVIISFSNNAREVKKNNHAASHFWDDSTFQYNWQKSMTTIQ